MSSFSIKAVPLISNYNLKKIDLVHDKKAIDPFTAVVMNPVSRGTWHDAESDRRVGDQATFDRFEWHYEYINDPQGGIASTNAQIYPTIIRHNFFWLLDSSSGSDVSSSHGQELFDYLGLSDPDIHSPISVENLKAKRIIPLYDRTMLLAPMSLANKVDNVGVAPEVEYFYVSYIPTDGSTLVIEEGIIDLTSRYRDGLTTTWGSNDKYDIQTGMLVEAWRVKFNEDAVRVSGNFRAWFSDF